MNTNNRKLFDEILVRNRGRFAGIARAYAGPEWDDLLQDILLQIWKSLDQVENRKSIDTWCYRLALNTGLMWRRSQKTDVVTADPQQLKNVCGASDGHDLGRLLEKFLDGLSRTDRAVMLMYMNDLPGKTMAEILGVNETAVRVRIHRIKQRLRDRSLLDE